MEECAAGVSPFAGFGANCRRGATSKATTPARIRAWSLSSGCCHPPTLVAAFREAGYCIQNELVEKEEFLEDDDDWRREEDFEDHEGGER